ncbi:MAG: hypothetical protein A2537_02045 [Candidatus Magasanikbacteria bacterium RIFOXYD2_FULL_36_9]|uniref:Transcriptional regulator n=1 Tax=Candidatus Magasanikbacteria bacterium RIFOXYD2_FULL_36_9 TaxID=1798707 RepID=A0A1F6NYH5_9BACT|nr:MAG: hypothetical protein A2537_02045 [Candidatus Magasanikbacteria bacterium RIFOXYD2_FULL_36_9]
MIEPYKGKIKLSLKKAQGQLKLLDKMIEEDRYCIDVAQQINAAIGLLKQINITILENHLQSCGTNKLSSKSVEEKDQFIKELIKTFNLTGK